MNFGKVRSLGTCEFWEAVNFEKTLNFWNLNVGKLFDFAKCVAWACRMIFHSCSGNTHFRLNFEPFSHKATFQGDQKRILSCHLKKRLKAGLTLITALSDLKF